MKINKNLFKTYLIYFIVLMFFVGIRIASSLGAFSFIENDMLRSNIATIIIQGIIIFLVPFLLCLKFFNKKPKQIFKDNYYNKISGKAVLISFALGILMFFFNLIVASFFSSILSSFGYSSNGGGSSYSYDTFGKFLLGVLFVAIMPAVSEEFLHRGMLMRNIGKETNYKSAIIISALCFGMMHLNIEQFFYATILGVIIGFVGAESDSIIPCMILHFTNNFLSVYFSYANATGIWGGDFYSRINKIYENNSTTMIFVFTILLFSLIMIAMGYLIIALFKETRLKKLQNALINVQKEVSGDNIEEISEKKLSNDFSDYILPNLEKGKDNISLFLPTQKTSKKQSLSTNLFLIGSLILGLTITFFTFVWGII